MDGIGPKQPLSDSQLDRELESALGVEPSPEFLARVRTRVAAEPRGELWRLAIRRWSFEPLAGVAVIGIVLAVVVPWLMRDGEAEKTAPIVAAVTGTPVEADGSAPAFREGGQVGVTTTVPTRSVSRIQKRRRGMPEVLISQDDRRAFDALLIAVAENRLPVRPTPVEEAGSALALAPLQIQQLRIEPLQLTGLEGANGS